MWKGDTKPRIMVITIKPGKEKELGSGGQLKYSGEASERKQGSKCALKIKCKKNSNYFEGEELHEARMTPMVFVTHLQNERNQ